MNYLNRKIKDGVVVSAQVVDDLDNLIEEIDLKKNNIKTEDDLEVYFMSKYVKE